MSENCLLLGVLALNSCAKSRLPKPGLPLMMLTLPLVDYCRPNFACRCRRRWSHHQSFRASFVRAQKLIEYSHAVERYRNTAFAPRGPIADKSLSDKLIF